MYYLLGKRVPDQKCFIIKEYIIWCIAIILAITLEVSFIQESYQIINTVA
jgi:hypothetical protein